MSSRNPTRLVLLAVLATLEIAAAGCRHDQRAAGSDPAAARVHVETAVAAARAVPQELTLTGVLDANQRTDLTANASGRVIRVFVELGQRVAAHAPIAQLDSRTAALSQREAKANVQSATEQLSASRKDCDRYQRLLAKGAITQQEYDRAVGQCQTQGATEEAARARAAEASQTLTDATIRAPFAGRIADRAIHIGDYVHPDTKVVTLLADDPLRIRLTVPERDIFAVKEGLPVRFETLGLPNQVFQATVKYIGGEVRPQTRDLVVEAIVDNHGGTLLPGMFVSAHLSTGQAQLPIVPKSALVTATSPPSLFVVEGGRLRQRIVQTGPPQGEGVPILEGVKPGERVVVNPSGTMSDGALVD
jgi:membrane fusion protein (multidrug efflux system)